MCFLIVILLVIFLLLYLWMPHLVSFSAAYPGPGCGGSRFSSEAQTLLATFTLAQEDFKAFPNQLWDIISPVSPRSASASPPRWTYLHHLPREVSKGHPGYFPQKNISWSLLTWNSMSSILSPSWICELLTLKHEPSSPEEKAHFTISFFQSLATTT